MNNYQIISKRTDEFGIHLIIKNKDNGLLHMEGHCLSKGELGKKAILREVPQYMLPVDQDTVNNEMKGE